MPEETEILEPTFEADEIEDLDWDEPEATAPEVPAFDAEAERARIREQVEAEISARRPAYEIAEQEPDLDELQFVDPKAYRAELTRQIRDEIMGSIAPTLKAVEADRTVNELGNGLGDAGRRYLRDNIGGIPIHQMPPLFQDMARRAARDVDRESSPARLSPERSTVSGGPSGLSSDEKQLFQMAASMGLSEKRFRELMKEPD